MASQQQLQLQLPPDCDDTPKNEHGSQHSSQLETNAQPGSVGAEQPPTALGTAVDGSFQAREDSAAPEALEDDDAGDADGADDASDPDHQELASQPPRGTASTLSPGSPRLRRTLGGSGTGVYARDATGVAAKSEFNGKISVGEDYQCTIPADNTADKAEEVTRVGEIRWCPVQAGASVVSLSATNSLGQLDDGGGGTCNGSDDRQQPSETACGVASFLEAARVAQPSLLADELMSALHDHQYDIARALDTLQSPLRAHVCSQQAGEGDPPMAVTTAPQHVLDVQSLDSWSEDDKAAFTDAVCKYGKDFNKIYRRVLPSRTVPQLILYYYLRWKGTPQFFEWQEQSFNQTNEDECAAPHCPWGSTDSDAAAAGGGGGGLLCCDGCPHAFHFSCCQPKPLSALNLAGKNWYCAKCTASRRRWGRELIPCSDNPARHDCSPCGGRGDVRLINDTRMLLPAPVMQYKSLSCNPRCKHCMNLLTGSSARVGVLGGDSASNHGRRRSGRQAAVAEVNVFRGAGLNVREAVDASNDGTESESDYPSGVVVGHSDRFSHEPRRPRIRGRFDETQTDDGRSSDSAEDKDGDETRSDRDGRRKRKRSRQSGEN